MLGRSGSRNATRKVRAHGRRLSSFPQGQVESRHLLFGRAEIHPASNTLLCSQELLSSCKKADKYPVVPFSSYHRTWELAHAHTITLLTILLVTASLLTNLMGKVVLKDDNSAVSDLTHHLLPHLRP